MRTTQEISDKLKTVEKHLQNFEDRIFYEKLKLEDTYKGSNGQDLDPDMTNKDFLNFLVSEKNTLKWVLNKNH